MMLCFLKRIFTWFLICQYTLLSIAQAAGDQLIFELKNDLKTSSLGKSTYTLHIRKEDEAGNLLDSHQAKIEHKEQSLTGISQSKISKSFPINMTYQNEGIRVQYDTPGNSSLKFQIDSQGGFLLDYMKGKGNFSFSTFNYITLQPKQLHAASLNLKGSRIRNESHLMVGDLSLEATGTGGKNAPIMNSTHGVITARRKIDVIKGDVDNQGGIRSAGNLVIDLHGNSLTNNGRGAAVKGVESTGGLSIVNAYQVINNSVISANKVDIKAGTVQNNSKGEMTATESGHLTTQHNILNEGFIGSLGQESSWTIKSHRILRNDKKISADKLTVKAQDLQNNQLIEAKSSLDLSGEVLANGGSFVGGDSIKLNDFGQVYNYGVIRSKNVINLSKLGDVINQSTIECGGILDVDSSSLTINGLIQAKGALLNVRHYIVAKNKITTEKFLRIRTEKFSNESILSGNIIVITTEELFENNGDILGDTQLSLNVKQTAVNNGVLTKGGNVAITSHGSFTNKKDITTQGSLVIEGTGSLENEADLKAATVLIQGFDVIKNYGVIFGAQSTDISFKQQLFNEALIQSARGVIQSSQGEMINRGEIHNLAMVVHRLQNKKSGFITGSAVTVSEGTNEGRMNTGTFSANGEQGFHNKNEMSIWRLFGQGHFRNHSSLKLLHRGQEASRIDIYSFLNDAEAGPIAEVSGAVVEVTSGTSAFILGQRGKCKVGSLTLTGDNGSYQNKGELTAASLTLDHLQSAFTNNHVITVDVISVQEDSQMANYGDVQVGLITGDGTFHNHNRLHLVRVVDGQDSGEGTLDIAHFYQKTQAEGPEARVVGKNITATASVEKFMIESGAVDLKSLAFEDSLSADRSLENHGTMNLDTLLPGRNKFSNYGDMTIDSLIGHQAHFINQKGLLDILSDVTLLSFENHGTAQLQGLNLVNEGINRGEIKLVSLKGTGEFTNYKTLMFQGDTPILQVRKFMNKSQGRDEARIDGKDLTVCADVQEFSLQEGKVTVKSLMLEGGQVLSENRGELTATQLLLGHLAHPFINHHQITVDELHLKDGSRMANHGDVQVGLITGDGAFHNHNRLHLTRTIDGQVAGEARLEVASFLNETQAEGPEARIMGKNVVLSNSLRTFAIRSGLATIESLILEAGEAALKDYSNKGTIHTKVLKLNQNKVKNQGTLTTEDLQGIAGHLVNEGTFAAKGTATFTKLDNQGTAHFEELDIAEQGLNQGTMALYSLIGLGRFTNNKKLTFLSQSEGQSTLKIAGFTNESIDGMGDAEIHGESLTITPTVRSLLLKQGKINVANLNFDGGETTVENHGTITGKTLTLHRLGQTFINHHAIAVDTLDISAELINHGDLQVNTVVGSGSLYNHHFLHLVPVVQGEDVGQATLGVAYLVNKTTNADIPAQVVGQNVVVSSTLKRFEIDSGSVDIEGSLTLEQNTGDNQHFENKGSMRAKTLLLNQHRFINNNSLIVGNISGSAGQLINQGEFSASGQTTFTDFTNSGIADLDDLTITGQGYNRGDLTLKSLKGAGRFYNQKKLTFQSESGQSSTIGIAGIANESENAEIHGENVTVTDAVRSFLLKQGKVVVAHLTFDGGMTEYKNEGEITATTLTLNRLHHPFINQKVITVDNLVIGEASTFINDGDLQAHIITGSGSFYNQNVLTLQTKNQTPATLKVIRFINREKEESRLTPKVLGKTVLISSVLQEFAIDAGLMKADLVTFEAAPQGPKVYQNKAKMKIEELFLNHHLFTNSGILNSQSIQGADANLLNQGVIKANAGVFSHFTNTTQALIDFLTINQTGKNIGKLSLKNLKGQGTFTNQATLKFTGTEQQPSQLGTTHFINEIAGQGESQVQATDLVVLPETQSFTLKSGVADIDNLVIQAGVGSTQCLNAGNLLVSRLQMNQSAFQNSGYFNAEIFEGTLQSFMNNKEVIITSQTSLNRTCFTNARDAVVHFKGAAQLKSVENHSHLTAEAGLETTTWSGQGNAEIQQSFKTSSVDNRGTLQLIKARTSVPQTFINHGNLILKQVTFSNADQAIENYKNLILEGGLNLAHLINHDHVYVSLDKYHISSLNNKHKIVLFGPQWTISTQGQADANLVMNKIQNTGEISAKGSLIYQSPTGLQGLWTSGGDLTYKLAGAVLTPEHLKGMTVGRKLVVEAGSFIASTPSVISIPHLVLYLSDDFRIASTLQTNTLEAYVKKSFTCGKAVVANGDLIIEAPAFPTDHADIHASGNATLISTTSSIIVGQKRLETTQSRYEAFDWSIIFGSPSSSQKKSTKRKQSHRINPSYLKKSPNGAHSLYGHKSFASNYIKKDEDLNCAPYHKMVSNGISVSAGGNLCLQSPQNLTVHGSIYSGNDLSLKVDARRGIITCDVGQIESLRHIHLYGYQYINQHSGLIGLSNKYATVSARYESDAFDSGWRTMLKEFGTLTHYVYTDMSALMQAGGNIHFHMPKVDNQGSTILAAENIYHQDKLVASPEKAFNNSFKNESLPQTFKFNCTYCDSFYKRDPKCDPRCSLKSRTGNLPPVPAYVLAGQKLSLKNVHVLTTGVMNAGGIDVHGYSFYAANVDPYNAAAPLKLRSHDRLVGENLIIDMVEFASGEFTSRPGFIQVTDEGAIVPKYATPHNLPLTRENILFVAESVQAFPYAIEPLLDSVEPMLKPRLPNISDSSFYLGRSLHFKVDLSVLHSVFQRTLTDYFKTQNLQGHSGREALQYCFDMAKHIKKNQGSSLVRYQDLGKYADIYIVFQMIEHLKKIWMKPLLVASVKNVNQYTKSGDVSASTTTANIHTSGDQTYIGQTVAAPKGIKVIAQGTLQRTTPKIRKTYGRSSREELGSTQLFYSSEGSIETFGHRNIETSTLTVAPKGDVTRGSAIETTVDSQILQATRTWGDSQNGGSEVTHTIPSSQTVSGKTIRFYHTEKTGKTHLLNTHNHAQGMVFDGGTVEIGTSKATNVRKTWKEDDGLFSSSTQTDCTQTPVMGSSVQNLKNAIEFTERTISGHISGSYIKAQKLINKTQKGLTVAPAVGQSTYTCKASQESMLSGMEYKENTGQEVMIPTTLDVQRIITLGSKLKLISTELDKDTVVEGIYETAKQELKSWNIVESKTTGIPAPILQVAAIALAIYSGGTAASTLYSALAGTGASASAGAMAALKLVGTQLGTSIISNGGKLEAALKSTFSDKGFLSLTAQVVSAGVLDKLGVVAPKADASWGKLIDYGANRAVVNAGVNLAFGRENLGEALRNAGVNFIYDVLGRAGANKIGELYGEGDLNFLTHKGAHAVFGAGLGALKGDALAGALGGFVSELVADVTKDDKEVIAQRVIERAKREGAPRNKEELEYLIREEMKATMNWGKVGAAVTVALAKHDIDVGVDVATNALENNLVPLVIVGVLGTDAIISAFGLTLAVSGGVLTAKLASDKYNEYKENQAAMDAHPEDARWVDEGVTTEETKARPLVTPIPEKTPTLGGYEGASSAARSRDEGYTAHHGVDTSILTSDELKEFSLLKENIVKVYKHDRFGKFYKNKEDKLYYTKDQANHGGSAWKVYQETGKGLEWLRDIDKFGKTMDKHKGDTGKFIPKKDLNGVNSK